MTQDENGVKPFASWLMDQAGGKTEAELTDDLAELVQAVIATGKKGTLQLTVAVEPLKEDSRMVVVKDEIKLRKPEHDRKSSMFWTDEGGALLRSDPNQRSIFDEISERRVNTTTGEVQD